MRADLSPLLGLGLALLLGCSGGDDAPSPALVADVDRLRLVMATDPTLQPMEEVEAVADARPVEAARRLRTGALPAARSQLERADSVEMSSEEGRRLKRRLLAAYRARIAALEDYEGVLVDASTDVEGLLSALRAQSDAERLLLAIGGDLQGVRPLAPEEADPETEQEEAAPEAPGQNLGAPRR